MKKLKYEVILICLGCNLQTEFINNFYLGIKSNCCGKHVRGFNVEL